MQTLMIACTESVYQSINRLPRCGYQTPRGELPRNGIYLFFERGEAALCNEVLVDRVVRVGTHRGDGRFPRRIREHYGAVHSFSGNKNGSVFRRHVGGALLRQANPDDPRLLDWVPQGGRSYREVEEQVSRHLRDNFTFVCFQVDTAEERLGLEAALISLFAKCPVGQPSAGWLGRSAVSPAIQRSGQWNTQELDAIPLTPDQFQRLDQLVQATIARRGEE